MGNKYRDIQKAKDIFHPPTIVLQLFPLADAEFVPWRRIKTLRYININKFELLIT